MAKLLIILLFILLTRVYSNKPRVWLKIPHFYVVSRVEFFLNENCPSRPYPNPLLGWAAYLFISGAATCATAEQRGEGTAMPAAVACRAAARRRIIVDDGECRCHFFVVCGVWICDVWLSENRKPTKIWRF